MSEQEITWVCCPNGTTGNDLRLSVVVVPHLRADRPEATLANFPALEDWSAKLTTIAWKVAFDVAPTELSATRTSEAPDPELWRAMFASSTPVRSFGPAPIRTNVPVITYPAAEAADAIRDCYSSASAWEGRGDGSDPAQALRPAFNLSPLEDFRADFVAELEASRTWIARRDADDSGRVEVIATHPAAHPAVARAYGMQQPLPTTADQEPEPLDFHQVVTLLGDHPTLLRRLGLVIDLTLPMSGVGDSITRISLSPGSQLPAGLTHRLPWTETELIAATGVFLPRARDPAYSQRVWPLDRAEYHLETLDVDSAIRNNVTAASSPDTSGETLRGLPALRNDGIALVHTGRAAAQHARVARAHNTRASMSGDAHGGSPTSGLSAEDLVRGYRIDVWDDVTGLFHSLHARRVRYTVDGLGTLPSADGYFEDEGFLQETLTGSTELHIHEHMFTWRGWSLSVPRPDAIPRGSNGEPRDPHALAALRTHVTAQVQPGTLPKLRFGRRYRFRLRTVDLAGNSLTPDAAPDLATREVTYLRYEPVLPPVVTPVGDSEAFGEGGTMHRLVIRRPTGSAETEGQHFVAIPGDEGGLGWLMPGAAIAPSERLLLPPPGSMMMAEQHGVLDDALGRSGNPAARAATRALLSRVEAELTYPVGEVVPYLPDPMAAGIAFVGLPGVPAGEVYTVPFEADSWDSPHPIRLRLEADELNSVPGRLAPSYDQASRTLVVFLTEGAACTVRVSSIIKQPELMALLQDAGARLTDDDSDLITARVRNNQHSMFTPHHELELVYATHRGVRADFQGDPQAVRSVGQPTIGLRASLAIDPATTDSVALHGNWIEHLDHGAGDLPENVTRSAQLFSWRPPRVEAEALPPIPNDPLHRHLTTIDTDDLGLPPHQFDDVGHRLLTCTPVTTSRFGDCYPPESLQPALGGTVQVRVLNAGVPPPPVVHSVLPSLAIIPQTVVRSDDEVPFATGGAPDDLPSEPGWTKTTQERHGGGIRVYLERPWFVTGLDEALGVVVVDPAQAVQPIPDADPDRWNYDPNNLRPQWFSQIGQDPTRLTQPVRPLTSEDFRNFDHIGSISALPDAKEAGHQLPATILGYIPQLEESSGLWHADIQVSRSLSYMPFVRLAVARHQPYSLNDDLSISGVSLVDIVQPLPSRTLTILRHTQDSTITITLWGTTYAERNDSSLAARVTGQIFMADSPTAEIWRPAEETFDLVRSTQVEADPTLLVDLEFELIHNATNGYWTANITIPPPAPGQFLRLLIVEWDQRQAWAGPEAKRVVYVGAIDL